LNSFGVLFEIRNGSWNETFGSGLGEYHSKGW